MAAIAIANVTETLLPQDKQSLGKLKIAFPSLAFGNGALTYDTNGIPLPNLLGMKNVIKRLTIQQPVDGLVYKYDPTVRVANPVAPYGTIRIYQGAGFTPAGTIASHTHDIKFIGGITATEPVAIDGGDTLGKNAATDRTIAGANSATKGGVVAAAQANLTGTAVPAAALVELGAVAVVATVLNLTVIGE